MALDEQIAAVRSLIDRAEMERHGFTVYPELPPWETEVWRAILARLVRHKGAIAALREIAEMEGAEITDSDFARKTLRIVTCALAALDPA